MCFYAGEEKANESVCETDRQAVAGSNRPATGPGWILEEQKWRRGKSMCSSHNPKEKIVENVQCSKRNVSDRSGYH